MTLVMLIACDSAPAERPRTITVYAAASTADAVEELAARFTDASGVEVRASFAGSSTLARQIERGAPADVFLSADRLWMDHLEDRGLIDRDSRRDVVTNTLVLIVPADGAQPRLAIEADADPLTLLRDTGRLAIGDPEHVPAGRYARRALRSLGWWDRVEPHVVPTLDVRAALRLVERGEADAGIVYTTDAAVSTRVAVVGRFAADPADAIHYPVALCRGASAEAAAFVDYLGTAEAREILSRHGFEPYGGPD